MVLCGIFIFLSGCAGFSDCTRSVGYWSFPLGEGMEKCGACARSGGYYWDGDCYRDNLADEVRACVRGWNGGYYLDGVCFKKRYDYDLALCERKYPDSFYYSGDACFENKREYDDLLRACITSGGDYLEGRSCVKYEEYDDYDDEFSSDGSKSRPSSPGRTQPVRRR